MSLLDSLLLEGYRDPHEVYISLRTDGQKGSGTIDDPYDGGTRLGPTLPGSLTCDLKEFVVRLFNHGLSVGSSFTIDNVHGPDAALFNGGHTVQEVLSPSHFTIMLANVPAAPPEPPFSWNGFITTLPSKLAIYLYWPVAKVSTNAALTHYDGVVVGGSFPSPNEAFAGDCVALGPNSSSFRYRLNFLPNTEVTNAISCTVTKIIHRFDEVMRTVPLFSVIRLGPGAFETRGNSPIYLADSSYVNVYVGFFLRAGHRLLGSGIDVSVLKLVLPLDEISQTTAIGTYAYGTPYGTSPYPVADYAEVTDLTVDCNASGHVAPYGIFPAPVTCGAVNIGGSFIRIRRVRAINFCTQGPPECFPLFITPGGLGNSPPTFSVIEDCIVEKPGENNAHETTLISLGGDYSSNGRSLISRHNYHNCEYANGVSSEHLAVASVVRVDDHHFKITTKRPHHRTTDNNIRLNNVRIGSANGAYYGFFNVTFKVYSRDSDTELTCESPGVVPDWPTSYPTPNVDAAFIGVYFFGRGALSGTGCVTEGDAIFNCTLGFYQDTTNTRDVAIRDNYCSNISIGLNFDFNPNGGGVSDPFVAKSLANHPSLTRSIDVNGRIIATFELPDEVLPLGIGFSIGDAVTIDKARINGDKNNPYNGTSIVTSVAANRRSFSYEMKADPGVSADVPSSTDPLNDYAIVFWVRWQVRRLMFENNIFDFYPFDSTTAFPPIGATDYGYLEGPPFMFPQSVFRNNLLRLLDGTPAVPLANGAGSIAFNLSSTENTMIESNVIGLADPWLVRYTRSRNVNAFNNRTPAGEALLLIEDTSAGGDTSTFQERETLEDRINDALVFAIL